MNFPCSDSDGQRLPRRHPRVLIVDDNELARDFLVETLTESGYEVESASSGEEALEMMRTGSFRLVVSDWVMPGMSGLELCRAIRGQLMGRYVYIILITSRDSKEDLVEALDAGADDFVAKPCDPDEMCVRLRVGERILSLENRDMTILAMAKIAESRDQETGAHLERIREYSRVLAQDLSQHPRFRDVIDGNYVEMIYATSPLHDIGKVGIPDRILLKRGSLTPDEYEEMKRHTTIGAESLAATQRAYPHANFLTMAREIAATHHEKWDGTGYPSGLCGEEIPLSGRIVALADVYDALTSRRCYKSSRNHEEVRFTIVSESGTRFDPDIVDCFVRNEERFAEIRRLYSVEESAAEPALEGLDQAPCPDGRHA